MAVAFTVPLSGFGAAIYTCVDKTGHKRVQMDPCAAQERVIGREEFTAPGTSSATAKEKPLPLKPPKPGAAGIQELQPKRTPGTTKEMLEEFEREQSGAIGAPNGVLFMSSVICRLREKYSEPDQRQLLLSQAQMLGAGVANGSMLVAAAMGQCANAPAESDNGVATMSPDIR